MMITVRFIDNVISEGRDSEDFLQPEPLVMPLPTQRLKIHVFNSQSIREKRCRRYRNLLTMRL